MGLEPALARWKQHIMNTTHSQKKLNNSNEINVGVDTGKHQLDIHIRPLELFFTVSNDADGIKEAIKIIKQHKPTRIVIEATGRLEHAFVIACVDKDLPICVINPALIRKFAGMLGQLAKTDALDAKLIAHFGEMRQPPLSTIKPQQLQLMSDLLASRQQLMKSQTMQKNRLENMPKTVHRYIKPILTALKNQITNIDKKLLKLIEKSEAYKAKNDIIQSMPGVGNVVAISLLSNMPELGLMTNKQAAALVGVAPINKDSGNYKGKRYIRGGRSQIRTVMYMAMMSAMQCNPVFKKKYQELVAAGKPKKVAIIACVRKMIVILNSMVRDGVMWNENYAK